MSAFRRPEKPTIRSTQWCPDVLIVCDLDKLDERGMRGAPDWVAEILSPSTAVHDQIVKIPIYERAGVWRHGSSIPPIGD